VSGARRLKYMVGVAQLVWLIGCVCSGTLKAQESCDVSGRIRNAVDIKALALSSQGSSGKRAASRTRIGLATFDQWLKAEEKVGCLVLLCV
jgi:hypothetical protein